MSRQLLAKNLLRFGAKGLTESKMMKYLKEQVDADAMMAWLQSQQAYAETLKRFKDLQRDVTKAKLVKSKRLEPVAPQAEELELNYFNNFVTLDGLQRGTKEAALQRINQIIEVLKDSDEIVITSGATAPAASLTPTDDGAPSKIDHDYGQGFTAADQEKFNKWNTKETMQYKGKTHGQTGNRYLARMRGENVKNYMVQQGIDANKIKVIPKIGAEKRFMNIQGYVLSDRQVITLAGIPKAQMKITINGGWSLIPGKLTDYYATVNRRPEVQDWKRRGRNPDDKPEILKQAEAKAALGKTKDLIFRATCGIEISIPGKTTVTLSGDIVLGTGSRVAASATYAKAVTDGLLVNTTKQNLVANLRRFNKSWPSEKYQQAYSFAPMTSNDKTPNQPSIQDIYKGKGYFTQDGAKSVQNMMQYIGSPIMIKMLGDWIQTISDSIPVDEKGRVVYMKYSNPSADKTGVVAKNNAAIDAALSTRINIEKTYDIEQLASQGIKGSSPTMQFTSQYWTGALYYDATVEPPKMGELDFENINNFFRGIDEFAK